MTVETDQVLSAIRSGEDSLPKLRLATGFDYAKLHPILHTLEFEYRSIQRNENADGFDRYTLMPEERPRADPVDSTVHTIPPAALARTGDSERAREMALVQRNAPYCVQCRGVCVLHGTDRTGKIRWRCRKCEVSFAGSGAVRDLNRIPPDKRQAAITAFNEAKSVRKVAAEVGIAPQTAMKIRQQEKIEALCPCGKDAKHLGWCAYRFQNSPERQATIGGINSMSKYGISITGEVRKIVESLAVGAETDTPRVRAALIAAYPALNAHVNDSLFSTYISQALTPLKGKLLEVARKGPPDVLRRIAGNGTSPKTESPQKPRAERVKPDKPTVTKTAIARVETPTPVNVPAFAESCLIEGGLALNVSLRVTLAELATWSPGDVSDFFKALATVQSLGRRT